MSILYSACLTISIFSAESPGVLLFPNAYNAFDSDTLDAAFGYQGVKTYDGKEGAIVVFPSADTLNLSHQDPQ